MNPSFWAAILVLLAAAFAGLELFIPSGGMLGFLSSTCLITSVVMVFMDFGAGVGAMYLLGLSVLIPVLFGLAVKWWPRTPIGRRILNLEPGREREIAGGSTVFAAIELMGKRGLAKTPLLPSGAIDIDGRTYDAISDGTVIEKGDPVEVVEIEGLNIVVRKVESSWNARQCDPGDRVPADSDAEPMVDDPFGDLPV